MDKKKKKELVVLNVPLINVVIDKSQMQAFNEEIEFYTEQMKIAIPAINDDFMEFRDKGKIFEDIKKEVKVKRSIIKNSFGDISTILNGLDTLEITAKDCEKQCQSVRTDKIASVSEYVNKYIENKAEELLEHGLPCVVESDDKAFIAKEKGLWSATIYNQVYLETTIDKFAKGFIAGLNSKVDNINKIIMQNVSNFNGYENFDFDKINFDYNNPLNIDFDELKQKTLAKAQALVEEVQMLGKAHSFFENGFIKETTKPLTFAINLGGEYYEYKIQVPNNTTMADVVKAIKNVGLTLHGGK